MITRSDYPTLGIGRREVAKILWNILRETAGELRRDMALDSRGWGTEGSPSNLGVTLECDSCPTANPISEQLKSDTCTLLLLQA